MDQQFTMGIEEEFQIVDPETRDIVSRGPELFEGARKALGDQVSPEMHQCMIEVGSKICKDIHEAREEVYRLRNTVSDIARQQGLEIVAASTHPFGHWADQKISEHERYVKLVEDMQVLSKSMLCFGMHVHVEIKDREEAVHVMNAARYFLPHLLTLSTSSPYWNGIETGLMSYRSEVMKMYPRTEIPDYFNSYSEYENYVKLLVDTDCIDNGKKIWWDLRIHPFFPTLEYRICDIPTRAEDVISIAALIQAITAKLTKLIRQNLGFRLYRRALIQENKWRALRYGLDGYLIDFGKKKEVLVRDLITELVEFVDDVLDDLGNRKEVERILDIARDGTSSHRQVEIFKETGDMKKVVDNLIEETMEHKTGVREQAARA